MSKRKSNRPLSRQERAEEARKKEELEAARKTFFGRIREIRRAMDAQEHVRQRQMLRFAGFDLEQLSEKIQDFGGNYGTAI